MSYAPESVFDELYTSRTSLSGRIEWGELFTMHRPDGGFAVAVAVVCDHSPAERAASAAGRAVAAPDDGASSGTMLVVVVVVVVVGPPGGRTSSG